MKAVGVIFSNIHDMEIKELTANRTLASVPFGGRFRLIDFALSNMVNSNITKVGIITKENYQSLMDHLGSGKHWDLSRKNGGLILLPPYGEKGTVLYKSRFEAMKNTELFLQHCKEDYVVMSDCDTVCNIDYSKVIAEHIKSNADITALYRKKELDGTAKKAKTYFEVDETNRITKTESSAKVTGEKNVFTNILVIGRKFLLNIIENSNELKISSFSQDVLTRTNEFRIKGMEVTGYFETIDSINKYYDISMKLLDKQNRDELFYKDDMNIYTKVRDSAPAKIDSGASVSNSIVADGCVIEGEVKNSILFRGVKIAKGAKIENSIIFQDCVIGANSSLNCVIADKQAVVLDKRILSGHETHPYFIAKNTVI